MREWGEFFFEKVRVAQLTTNLILNLIIDLSKGKRVDFYRSGRFRAFVFFLMAASLSLLPGCQSIPSSWRLEEDCLAHSAYHSVRLCSGTGDPYRGIEFELMALPTEWRAYCHVSCIPLKPIAERYSHVEFSVTIGDLSSVARAPLFLGGQKALLPPDTAEEIIAGLLRGTDVILSKGRYRCTLPALGFEKAYKKWATHTNSGLILGMSERHE